MGYCHAEARQEPGTHAALKQGVHRATLIPKHASSDFSAKHYDVVRPLGEGNFGHVSLVRERATGVFRVCKTVSWAGMADHVLQLVRREVQFLAELDHPHVVRLHEFADDSVTGKLVLILEYIPGIGCDVLLDRDAEGREPQKVEEEAIAHLIAQVVAAVGHCHGRGILHRDIKPENIMFSMAGACDRGSLCKLIDFGLSCQCGPDEEVWDFLGTPPYMAPEIVGDDYMRSICSGVYTSKADIWSIGACTLEMLAGLAPFGKPQEQGSSARQVFRSISAYGSGKQSFEDLKVRLEESPWWIERSAEAQDFVRWLLEADPNGRPNALEALEHPWLRNHWETEVSLFTADMIRSMSSCGSSSPIARRCALLVAARGEVVGRDRLGTAFFALDIDGSGEISKDRFAEAIAAADSWWRPINIDCDEVFDVADLDRSGGLSFTEFVAACIYKDHDVRDVALQSFQLLDLDRDGRVSRHDLQILRADDEDDDAFEQVLGCLAIDKHEPFGLDDWRSCFLATWEDCDIDEEGNAVRHLDAGGLSALGVARKLAMFDPSRFFPPACSDPALHDADDQFFMEEQPISTRAALPVR